MCKKCRFATRWLTLVIEYTVTVIAILATVLPVAAQAETDDTTPMEPVVVPPVTPAEVERLIGGMPRVTLHLKDAPLEEVLTQLNQQGGIQLQFDMRYRPVDLKQVVSFDADDMLLWETVQALEDQVHGQLIFVQDGAILHGTTFRENMAPHAIRGPLFFLNPGAITREAKATRVFATDEVTAQDNFSLGGQLVLDPRFRCISGPTVRVDEMVDDKGGSLLGDKKEFNGASGSGTNRNYMSFKVDLKNRPDMGSRIARLKGTVSTLFAAQSELWEINDPRNAAGASRTVRTNVGDMTYRLDAVLKLGDTLRFQFVITGPVLGVFDNQPAPTLYSIIAAYDANGKVMDSTGGSYSGSSARRRDAGVDFNLTTPNGIPSKFVFALPLDIPKLEIPFELKDFPLPPTDPATPVTTVAGAPEKRIETPALSLKEALQRTGKSPLVTLHFKATSAADVVAELARQSGVEVAFSRDPERTGNIPTISIDVEQQPFWDALRAILAACKLRFTYAVDANSIELVADALGTGGVAQWQGPLGSSGLARIMAIRCEREQHAQVFFASQQSRVSQSLKLSCLVALPPQLYGMPFTSRVRVDEALDEKGNSLRLTPENEAMFPMPPAFSIGRQFNQEIVLRPREDSRWLSQLKGTIRLDTMIRGEIWEIPDALKVQQVARKVSVKQGENTFEQTYTLDNFTVNDEEFKFTVHMMSEPEQKVATQEPDAARRDAARRAAGIPEVFGRHVQLSDEGGQIFPIVYVNVPGATPDTFTIRVPRRIHARNMGTPDKLVLELPTEIQPVEIPFEFKDVPLP